METSPLICCANQWSGFYMIRTSIMIELILCYCDVHNEKLTNLTLYLIVFQNGQTYFKKLA